MLEKIADRTEDESIYAMLDMMGGQIERMSSYYMDYAQNWDPFTGMGMEVDMPYQRESKKIGRNDPCPCGSGKNIKNVVESSVKNLEKDATGSYPFASFSIEGQ